MEQWRDVVGYEGFYQVSDYGNVVSLNRVLPADFARGVRKVKQSLQFSLNKQGRVIFGLCMEGKAKRHQAHRLVYEAFNGATDAAITHIDGNPLNNALTNLAVRPTLTEDDVAAIRASNDTQQVIAKRYNVTQATISHVINGKSRHQKTAPHIVYEDLFNPI